MKILALESSATAASVALCEGDRLLGQSFLHTGLTHSQTLLPLVERLLSDARLKLSDLDLLAVSVGPGSFTGLRIGVSTIKGLAFASGLPCAPCSTLAAMAWNAVGLSGPLCCCMDARRAQLYCARFHSDGSTLTRLSPDDACSLDELAAQLATQNPWLIGDGAALFAAHLQEKGIPARLAPPNLRLQSAFGVARLAQALAAAGETISGAALLPQYLRLSQAERERLEREQTTNQS